MHKVQQFGWFFKKLNYSNLLWPDFTGKECEDSELVSHLMNCKEGRVAISPFVCLSGNSDADLLQPNTPNHVSGNGVYTLKIFKKELNAYFYAV